MDRTIAPEVKNVSEISFVNPINIALNEHVTLHWMKDVPNETARMELYFDAGTMTCKDGTSSFVNNLLFSGDSQKSAMNIHQELDYLGAYFDSSVSTETATLGLYGLRDNFPAMVRIVHDALTRMSCVESEVKEVVADRKQNYLVNMEKTKFQAQREFQKRLFASSEIYSKVAQLEFYENVSPEKLKEYYRKHYLNGLSKINLVGNFDEAFVDEIKELFQPWAQKSPSSFENKIENKRGQTHVEVKDAMQSAIRVGKILFNKKHQEFIDFQILNTILGDYFGSRLMTNIREDKGFTYGIGSMVAEYKNFGYFMIATEVAKEFKEATLDEIKKEIEILQNDLVSEDELGLIRNYLLGQMLKSADGPYSMMDLYLSVEWHDKDFSYYNQVLERIRNITPQRIQDLAKEHLNWSEMTIVSAG